jgi:hypothetical protein
LERVGGQRYNTAQSARISPVGDVVLDAIGAVEADRMLLAGRQDDTEAVAIGPCRRDQADVLEGLQFRAQRQRRAQVEQQQK